MSSIPTAVVVPLDGSDAAEAAIAVAVEIADLVNGRLILTSAHPEPAELLGYLDAVAHLAEVCDHPAEVIVDADLVTFLLDQDVDRDVIVCRTTGLYRRDAYTQSAAVRRLTGTSRPVMKVGPNAIDEGWFNVERIVVPTDSFRFAGAAMRLAAEWSDLLDVPITILHIASPDEAGDSPSPCLDSVFTKHPVLATRRRRTSFLEVVDADPALEILDEAGTDALLVMATHGRVGTDRLVHGSVTEQVIRHAHRPVLTVRCEDEADEVAHLR